MFSKTLSRFTVSVSVFVLIFCFVLSENIALAENPPGYPDLPDQCGNNDEFTTDFRLGDCKFKTRGINPYFILKPGYRLVLEEAGKEKSVETVLDETKRINLDGRRIKTRVLEERAIEIENGEEKTVEISLNWFAICKKTNAVYYFGEWSRDCEDGFDENDECTGEESNLGSWEAGVNGARPGVMMAGTPLLGAKYFQEIAPPDAVDRGEIAEMGLDWPEELDPGEVPEYTGCIKIFDTNPTQDGECGEEDAKIYCPGIGLVQDQDLELVWSGFVDDDDDDDDDDDNDDDNHRRRWR
jgi:hypothetical protein